MLSSSFQVHEENFFFFSYSGVVSIRPQRKTMHSEEIYLKALENNKKRENAVLEKVRGARGNINLEEGNLTVRTSPFRGQALINSM